MPNVNTAVPCRKFSWSELKEFEETERIRRNRKNLKELNETERIRRNRKEQKELTGTQRNLKKFNDIDKGLPNMQFERRSLIIIWLLPINS
jgi:uncharacterized membrane protein (DUF106 family)